ncbi:MAG: NERD domain-containing protein [Firmicutes bacterium]|nr:NERD domain-containing protein [Bacillota bacterium]
MLFLFIVLFVVVVFGAIMLPPYLKYSSSNYEIVSGNSFSQTFFDKGIYGEFLTFYYLEKLEGHNRIMTNLYIPKENGATTEVDLIMLSQTGIYVFESKNYSGWIFGDERNKNWTQTLPNKQKNKFFNPIWQNKGHINALKSVVGLNNYNIFKSYIIFSERCTLKKISVTSPNIKVINRNQLSQTIKQDIQSSPNLLTKGEVDQLYLSLQRYTGVDDVIKKAHVDNVNKSIR